MKKINYISRRDSSSVSFDQIVQHSFEFWKVSVPVDGKGDQTSYCLKMGNHKTEPVPIVVYRFAENEIYPELDNTALLEQQHITMTVKIFEEEAKKYEKMLKDEYPNYKIISISTVLTYELEQIN